MTLRGLGWAAAGVAALVLGLLAAFLAVALGGGESCPGYDDEGMTAAAGSPYAVALCGPDGDGNPVWGLVAVGVASIALAVAVVVLARGVPQAPWIALLLLAAGPLVLMLLLTTVLPQDCLGGPDGSDRCETNRELL